MYCFYSMRHTLLAMQPSASIPTPSHYPKLKLIWSVKTPHLLWPQSLITPFCLQACLLNCWTHLMIGYFVSSFLHLAGFQGSILLQLIGELDSFLSLMMSLCMYLCYQLHPLTHPWPRGAVSRISAFPLLGAGVHSNLTTFLLSSLWIHTDKWNCRVTW